MLKRGSLGVKREFAGQVQAAPVATQIEHDPIQLALEASIITQMIKGEVGLQQSFLDQFVRNFFLANHPQREMEGHGLITLEQTAKSVCIVCSCTGDELSISFFFQGQRNLSSPSVSSVVVSLSF